MSFREPGDIITLLLAILCVLASLDLWRQYAINDNDYWFYNYVQAMKSKSDFWTLGFRLEDLEYKVYDQRTHWENIRHAMSSFTKPIYSTKTFRGSSLSHPNIRADILALNDILRNDSSVYQIRCEKNGPFLRIGTNDFRTDSRDECQLFTNPIGGSSGPQNMFETVPLGDGSFGLKAVSNGLYLRTVPPPSESSTLPWKIVIGGSAPGASEKFYVTDDGYLYSPLMGGLFQCDADRLITGFRGKYGSHNHFIFELVSNEEVQKAYEIVSLSDQIINIQSEYTKKHQTTIKERNAAVKSITGMDSTAVVRICIAIPVTSKGTAMKTVADSPLWPNLFESFIK
eukprot:gene3182-6278_t